MSTFQVGDRLIHTYMGKICSCTFVGYSSSALAFVRPDPGSYPWGTPNRTFDGKKGLYLFNTCELKLVGPPLSPQEKVIAKIKALDARFKNKTLRKTTMKPLALPR